jgi:DNA modification methylase
MKIAYETDLGVCIQTKIETFLKSKLAIEQEGKIDLIFTSPPFPLNRKKKYGNLQGDQYVEWLSSLAPAFKRLLSPLGSIVIEMGNAWEAGQPVMSTLALEALLAFKSSGDFFLCQQFIWNNPARLPSPAQWVNVDRIRIKDSFTHLWWLSSTTRPKANNRRVLKDYSDSMYHLLKSGKYNAGKRPSEHHISSKGFLKDNEGAIPSNVITIANTGASSNYLEYCKQREIQIHPARMPIELAEFFIKFLTEPGDLVLDPFAGSNTTGAASQYLGRHWIATEPQSDYVIGSKGRFNFVELVDDTEISSNEQGAL